MGAPCTATFLLMLVHVLLLCKVPYCDAIVVAYGALDMDSAVCVDLPTTTPPPVCVTTQSPSLCTIVTTQKSLSTVSQVTAQRTTITTIGTQPPGTTRSPWNASTTTEAPVEEYGYRANRIVGGVLVDITEVPYQASLQKSGSHICGACIITKFFLTTAAHCNIANASLMRVRVGSSLRTSGGHLHGVAEMISHPNYEEDKADYDFCLIKLKTELVFSPSCRPIKIIKQNEELSLGSYLTVQGWGQVNETGPISLYLLQITVPLIPTADCIKVYGNGSITKRMFCAGDLSGAKDSCQGDSGGPAVCEGILVGTTSWGYGCARAGYPGVYAKISSQRDWIVNVTGYVDIVNQPAQKLIADRKLLAATAARAAATKVQGKKKAFTV